MSSFPRAALPPTDHVARALLQRGARESALLLLRAAVRRDAGERACAALLKALEARPDASVAGPEIALDIVLIDAYVARGMLLEARALLTGTGLDRGSEGGARARALDTLIAPIPVDASPALEEAARHLLDGGAALALSLLDEQHRRGGPLPPWAEERRRTLCQLLIDRAEHDDMSGAGPAARAVPGGPADVRADVGRLILAREVPHALERLRAHAMAAPRDVDAAVAATALERLWTTLQGREAQPADYGGMRTVPMSPSHVGDLNVRMGNLGEAERIYRRIVMDDPTSAVARATLDDVQAVRRYLDPAVGAPTPLAGIPRAAVDAAIAREAEIGTRATEPVHVPAIDTIETAALAASRATPAPPTRPAFAAPGLSGPGASWSGAEELGAGGAEDGYAAMTHFPGMPEEPTRRVADADLAALRAAARSPERGVAAPRERVDAGAPPVALSKKGAAAAAPVAAGYGPSRPAAAWESDDWDDDAATGVIAPDVEAELLLKQGFAERALAGFRMLAAHEPGNERLARRVAEIEALIALERAPMPGEQTVRRDISALQHAARPTARLHVPEDVRAAAERVSPPRAPHGQLPGVPTTGVVRVQRVIILR